MDLSRVTLQMVLKQTESSLLINLRLTSSAATKLGMKIATARAMIIRIVYTCSIHCTWKGPISDPFLTYLVWVVGKR